MWHQACDSLVSFSATTPPISSLSVTVGDLQACGEIYTPCVSAGSGRVICMSSATATLALLTCLCEPTLTSLYSVCAIGMNVSCDGVPGNTNDIIGHTFCAQWLANAVSYVPFPK